MSLTKLPSQYSAFEFKEYSSQCSTSSQRIGRISSPHNVSFVVEFIKTAQLILHMMDSPRPQPHMSNDLATALLISFYSA